MNVSQIVDEIDAVKSLATWMDLNAFGGGPRLAVSGVSGGVVQISFRNILLLSSASFMTACTGGFAPNSNSNPNVNLSSVGPATPPSPSTNVPPSESPLTGAAANGCAEGPSALPQALNTVNVSTSQSWCSMINAAKPGDRIVLASGNYSTPCPINLAGTVANPIVITSQDPTHPAVFNYTGSSSNVMDVNASNVIFDHLAFQNTASGVVAIRFYTATNVTVQNSQFNHMGSNVITGNAPNGETLSNVVIQDNTFTNLTATPLYFGCQDGATCFATNLVVQRNDIDASGINDPTTVGYGLEIKLNSYGTVQSNTIYDSQGPGVMVYGSNKGNPANIIQSNYIEGARHDAGINVGGGPAKVFNNILVGNEYGGIYAQNYESRNLQKNVEIVNNTFVNNQNGGIVTDGWSNGVGDLIALNAFVLASGTSMVSPTTTAGTILDNITCGANCFAAQLVSTPYNFTPISGGPLVTSGLASTTYDRPTIDFFGVLRPANTATRGAILVSASTSGLTFGGMAASACTN